MLTSTIRWAFFVAALIVVGPLAYLLMSTVAAVDGSHGATPLLAAVPLLGFIRYALAIALVSGFGYAASRVGSARWAMFVAGVALAWGSWQAGPVDRFLRMYAPVSTMWHLAGEALILGLLVTAGAWLIWMDKVPALRTAPARGASPLAARLTPSLVALAVTLVAGWLASWLVAQDAHAGQSIAAGAIGAFAAACVGYFIAPDAPPWVYIAGLALLSIIGCAYATFAHGSATALELAANGGTLVPPARVLPIHWLAGGLIGVPLGLSCATSLEATPIKHPA